MTFHCPPLAGAGGTIKTKSQMGVDKYCKHYFS